MKVGTILRLEDDIGLLHFSYSYGNFYIVSAYVETHMGDFAPPEIRPDIRSLKTGDRVCVGWTINKIKTFMTPLDELNEV